MRSTNNKQKYLATEITEITEGWGKQRLIRVNYIALFSVTQSVEFFAACKDYLSGFYQHFRRCTACGHQAGDDFTPFFRQHVPVGFRDFFD